MRTPVCPLIILVLVLAVTAFAGVEEIPRVEEGPFSPAEVAAKYPMLEALGGKAIELGIWAMEKDNWPGMETPHVEWAKPLAGKPLAVLFIVSLHEGNMRDVKEIEARLDCEVHMLVLPSQRTLDTYAGDGGLREYVEQHASEYLSRPYDVIVANQRVRSLSPELQQRIIAQVEQGAGLIYQWSYRFEPNEVAEIMPGECSRGYLAPAPWEVAGDTFVVSGVPWGILPDVMLCRTRLKEGAEVLATQAGQPLLIAGRHGQGRTLGLLTYNWECPPWPQFSPEDHLQAPPRYWEYMFSFFARAILWAGGWEPPVELSLPPPRELVQFEPVEVALRLKNTRPQAQRVVLDIQVRDDQYQEVGPLQQETVNLSPGEEQVVTVQIAAPFRNGLHFVDVIARNTAGEVVNWGTTTLMVQPAVKLEITVSPEILSPGDSVKIRVSSEGVLPEAHTARLRTEIWDTWERCLACRKTLTSATEWSDSFDFSTRAVTGIEFRVVARLENADGLLSQRQTYFYLPDPGWNDYMTLMWPGRVRWYFREDMFRLYRRSGISALICPLWAPKYWSVRPAVRANLAAHGLGGAAADQRSSDWDLETLLPTFEKNTSTALDAIGRYGLSAISLGDEPGSHSALTLTEPILARYRDYLRETYGNLAALNQQWDTDYAGFEEIEPMYVEEARHRSNPAPWLDYRLFEDDLAASIQGESARAWRAGLGQHVDIGYDGTFGLGPQVIPYGRLDYVKMIQAGLNYWSPYPQADLLREYHAQGAHSQWYVLRSLTEGPIANGWVGYGNDPANLRRAPWAGAMYGSAGTGYFAGPEFVLDSGALLPRGDLIGEPTRQLREGLGKLLMQAEFDGGEVGLLLDQPSMYLQWLMGKREDIDLQLYRLGGDARAAWEYLLLDCQVPFSYVPADQVGRGGLQGKKLLILPGVWRMSEETAQSLRQWVAEGGVLVADLCPAIFNEHGQPLQPGYLDDLFGFRRNRLSFEARPGGYTVGVFENDGRFQVKGEWLRPEVWERDIEVADGKALGGHTERSQPPALILKRTGRGAALYMNWFETFYHRHREYRVRRLLRAMLSLAEVEPPVTVRSEGEILPFYRVTRLHDGPITHVGVMRSSELGASHPEQVDLLLPEMAHCYDVRQGTYLGYRDQVQVSLSPGGVKIITCLPYRLEGLALRAPDSLGRGEVLNLSAQLQGGDQVRLGDHVLRVEVYAPDGELVEALTANVRAPRGRMYHRRLMAVNAAPGTWRVRVIDPISHAQAEKLVQVQ